MKKLQISLLSILFLCLAFILFIPSTSVFSFAKTNEGKTAQLFSPTSAIEYNEVASSNSILFSNGKIYTTNSDLTKNSYDVFDLNSGIKTTVPTALNSGDEIKPLKILPFSSNQLLMIINGTNNLFLFNTDTKEVSQIFCSGISITAENFLIIDNKLFAVSSERLNTYSFNGTTFKKESDQTQKGARTLCYCGGYVLFSINGTSLYKAPLTNIEDTSLFIQSFIPETITSDKDNIYFMKDDCIYKKSITDNDSSLGEKMEVENNFDFELGSLGEINSICYKDNSLLIASTYSNGSAISEYEIDGTTLSYTGFSISKGNTAYNRISNTATDIEKNGEYIAVIDGNKISIINTKEKSFKNILLSEFSFTPTYISLGKEKLLVASSDNYCFVDLIKNEETNQLETTISEAQSLTNILDVVFANNNFYALINTDTDSIVYKIKDDIKESVYTVEGLYSTFTIDIKGNFIFNEDNESKILTDLVGNKFSVKDNKLNGYSLVLDERIDAINNIKSFALDYESEEIYFILENEEVILYSTEFDNQTISKIEINSEYKTSDNIGKDIEELKVYTITENANAYNIKVENGKINFIGYYEDYNIGKNEFVCIYNAPTPYEDFYILSGFDTLNKEITLLVNKYYLTEKEDFIKDENNIVYVSTPVDLYYLPIINENRVFSLREGESVVRLPSNVSFETKKEITINDYIFYYGEIKLNDKTYKAYIPKDFTVLILSNEYIRKTFVYKDVHKTSLLTEDNKEIIKISEDEKVKVLETLETKSLVEYDYNGTTYCGYITNEEIIEPTDNTIKIVVCLAFLTVCAFITTLYFGFLRKNN